MFAKSAILVLIIGWLEFIISEQCKTCNYQLAIVNICLSFTVLDVQAFERLLGPCMDIMKRNIDEYEEQLIQVFGDKASISDLR